MDLILWRHAEAVEIAGNQTDLSRELTQKGNKQAARMASWLDKQLPETTKIWASPAVRSEQTARALGRKFKISPEISPGASVDQLLALTQWPNAKGYVLVVGHQPTLGQTVARLLNMNVSECAFKKGAIWWLRYRQREDEENAVVVTVQSPDLL